MRPVNLMPSGERRDGVTTRTGPVAYIVVGVLAIALAAVCGIVVFNKKVSDREAEAAQVEAHATELEARADGLSSFVTFMPCVIPVCMSQPPKVSVTNRTPAATRRRAISIRWPASWRPYSSRMAAGSASILNASRAWLELIRLYYAISDQDVRRQFLDMVKTTAKPSPAPE